MKNQTAALLNRAQRGDVEAFAALFEPLRQNTWLVAVRLVGPDDAEDIVMETYLKAWQAIPRFNRRSSLKTWLYRITYNCAVDFLRAKNRRKEQFPEQHDGRQPPWARMPDTRTVAPDKNIEKTELREIVQKNLSRLPEEHRITLMLRFADGLNYTEIAAATGVSTGTVMSRLFYGKRRLRKLLEKEMET
jgi:RNA polymerase sigma-70 factor (ECF subfamily)